jgi:hypothetical protein
MSNIIETIPFNSRLICVGLENSKNLIVKDLWLRIEEKNDIDLKTFFEQFKNILFIHCFNNNIENGIESGRIFKNDSEGAFNIDERVYFNPSDVKGRADYNEETYLATVGFADCYKSESDCSEKVSDKSDPVQFSSSTLSPENWLNLNILNENSDNYNTPFDYANDDDSDDSITEIEFITKTVINLYAQDPYRLKEAIRDIYAIINCRKRAKDLAVNETEFNQLDQAMNLMYLIHFYQHKKKDQALDISSKHYKVSKIKIEGIWNSLVGYKRHFGEAIQFKKKSYK